jgi:hypothetical protein
VNAVLSEGRFLNNYEPLWIEPVLANVTQESEAQPWQVVSSKLDDYRNECGEVSDRSQDHGDCSGLCKSNQIKIW